METIKMTGKAAVFARGFMSVFGQNVPLRECQDAGKALVEELGEEISVAYISNLSRDMHKDGIFSKRKVGRRYFLKSADFTNDFIDFLAENPEWGNDVIPDSMLEVQQRTDIIDFLDENHSVLIHHKRQMSKASYAVLQKRFKAGQLMMAFIEPGGKAGVKIDGVTYVLKEFHG
jgi:hypothetical protein